MSNIAKNPLGRIGVETDFKNFISQRELSAVKKLVINDETGKESIFNTENIKTLEELTFNTTIDFNLSESIARLPSLRILKLSGTAIINNALRGLSGSKSLVKIDCSCCDQLTDVSPFEMIETLDRLDLYKCYKLTNIGKLGKLPKLRILNLYNTPITNDALRGLSGSKSFWRINCCGCKQLTDASPLETIETLAELKLCRCENLTTIGRLGKLPKLRILLLSNTDITDDALRGLSGSKKLVKINCVGCRQLTDVTPLAFIYTLKWVWVGCYDDYRGVEDVERQLNIRVNYWHPPTYGTMFEYDSD